MKVARKRFQLVHKEREEEERSRKTGEEEQKRGKYDWREMWVSHKMRVSPSLAPLWKELFLLQVHYVVYCVAAGAPPPAMGIERNTFREKL